MSSGETGSETQEALLDKIEAAAAQAEDEGEMLLADGQPPEPLVDEATFLDNQFRRLKLVDYQQDIQARKDFANKLFYLIVLWLLGVFYLIAMSGAQAGNVMRLTIPENVLLATIGGTTASILGLLFVVVKYLFPKR